MSNLTYVGENTFETEVLQADRPVLVDFYADWCAPCRALAPVIEEVARELERRLKVVKLDVDETQDLSLKHGVQSIPTLVLFKDGEEADRLVGFLSKQQLIQRLESHLTGAPV